LYIAADGPRRVVTEKLRSVTKRVRLHLPLIGLAQYLHSSVARIWAVRQVQGPPLTGFFEQESEGIILEDDVVPVQSFFPFCSELLNDIGTIRE